MVEILKRVEAVPVDYPAVPDGLSVAAAALDSDMLWARLESYIAHRWTARAVVWTVQGPGTWSPDLAPVTLATAEIWQSEDWSPVTLEASPLGGWLLPGVGIYRFAGAIDAGTVPAGVTEAFRRLAEYSAEDPGTHGASTYEVELGPIGLKYDRSPAWLAKAMQNSGAADLLRPYRRAG